MGVRVKEERLAGLPIMVTISMADTHHLLQPASTTLTRPTTTPNMPEGDPALEGSQVNGNSANYDFMLPNKNKDNMLNERPSAKSAIYDKVLNGSKLKHTVY